MGNTFLENYLWLIPILPLLGAVINGFVGYWVAKRFGEKVVGAIGCTTVFLSLCLSVYGLWNLIHLAPDHQGLRSVTNVALPWFHVGSLHIDWAFLFDPLSAVMCLVVTGVGFLIHVYSIGYMHGDKSYYRYFCYLNLFTFAMLCLVLGDNILVMFLGWEGVGLCSYLLIGFWFEDTEKAIAGMKAFIVNRIGDFGFIVGVFLLFWTLGSHGIWTMRFAELAEHAHLLSTAAVTAVTICFFIGATGKSAQIPLYVWLPDAMAGPTPVSALIHAATMVTAGVYMIGRLSFLYTMAPISLHVVAVVAAGTAFYAATIGLLQNDIKKVLAYSTVSQLGFMFMAMGVGAFSAGIFHLVTHAFFKALLFLGSGSVIHAISVELDMRKLGGLHKHMPITSWTFLIGTLAIAGCPLFSGFFSKDEILWQAFSSSHGGSALLWLVGFLAAGMTAFYMTRLVCLTFFGECRADEHAREHLHESPPSMTVPLILLAAGAVLVGYVGVPEVLGGKNHFHHFLAPVFGSGHPAAHGGGVLHEGAHHSVVLEYSLMVASVVIAALGAFAAYYFYLRDTSIPSSLATAVPRLYRTVYNKYYMDEIYRAIVILPVLAIGRFLAFFCDLKVIDGIVDGSAIGTTKVSSGSKWVDDTFVDGAVNGTAWTVLSSGKVLRHVQTGKFQTFLLYTIVIVGAILDMVR